MVFSLDYFVIYGGKLENRENPGSFRENPDNFGRVGI